MAAATRQYFLGEWQMTRIIENVPEGVIGEVWGQAVFRPGEEGLICEERGVMRFRGADYNASRVSRWRFAGDGRIEVLYDDGRPFHDFDPDDPRAEHLCGPDQYRVAYRFDRDSWESRWDVAGPRKDYAMTTLYRRVTVSTGRDIRIPFG